jgi:hypothetical protein
MVLILNNKMNEILALNSPISIHLKLSNQNFQVVIVNLEVNRTYAAHELGPEMIKPATLTLENKNLLECNGDRVIMPLPMYKRPLEILSTKS